MWTSDRGLQKLALAFLLALLGLTAMLSNPCIPSVFGAKTSGTISFQEDSIAELDVYYDDFSFVFQYKTRFMRLRPFVIYDGNYYGMKAIVQYIKNNYPNIDYSWLIDKAERAVHYGFNLTRLPQNIADKIDYLGFRLVDYNFPLSWFELETVEIFPDDGLPYNVTRIHVPRVNLSFSFEDLYPLGYSIQHINSTYILVGNVKGKTDLILDPITYSAPTITVLAYYEDSPCTFWDLWNASNVNGWGVVHNNNETDTQYQFDALIYLGNSTYAGRAYLEDTNKQITFSDNIVASHWQVLLYLTTYSRATFGQLDDAVKKYSSDGCQFFNLEQTYHSYFTNSPYSSPYNGTLWIYSCTFYSIQQMRLYTTHYLRAYNCVFTKNSGVYGGANSDQYNNAFYNHDGAIMGYVNSAWERIFFMSCNVPIYQNGGGSFSVNGFEGINNTYISQMSYGGNGIKNLTDCTFENWVFYQVSGGHKFYRKYSFNLELTYGGFPINNATVSVSHLGENPSQDFSTTTNSTGQISTQALVMGFYNFTGGNTIYAYAPFRLTVTHDDYETYTQIFDFDEALDWVVELQPDTQLYQWITLAIFGFIGGLLMTVLILSYRKTRK